LRRRFRVLGRAPILWEVLEPGPELAVVDPQVLAVASSANYKEVLIP